MPSSPSSLELHADIALVTGCSPGSIGAALAKVLKTRGYRVLATQRASQPREHLESLGITVVELDFLDKGSISRMIEHVKTNLLKDGRLNLLINNAGVDYVMPATDYDMDKVEQQYAVNVFGPIRLVREFGREIIAAKGTIVNIGSIAGVQPWPYSASYCGSKAALIRYGDTIRSELKPFGVKVVNVIAGCIESNIFAANSHNELPEDSLYQPIAAEFDEHVRRPTSDYTRCRDFAVAVIDEIERPNPKAWFWYAKFTWSTWLIDTFGWRDLWDWFFRRMFHFDKLEKIVQGK